MYGPDQAVVNGTGLVSSLTREPEMVVFQVRGCAHACGCQHGCRAIGPGLINGVMQQKYDFHHFLSSHGWIR